MEQNTVTHSAQETSDFGQKLAGEISPGALLCLRCDVGGGKTTREQELLEGLGAEGA